MLQIIVPARDNFNELTGEFITNKETTLQLEHSLISISKWEGKWCVPFLDKGDRTNEQMLDYIKCMTVTPNVPDEVFENLTKENIDAITKYIQSPMTATTFSKDKNSKSSRERVTSELIYYWMVALNIPFECQKWHINRLLTLIKICNLKNQPGKKMKNSEIYSQNNALNAARRKALGTKG